MEIQSAMPTDRTTPRAHAISDRTLARVQAISGLVFAVFLVLHLSTSFSAILGQGAYDQTLSAVRRYYRFPLIEIAGVMLAAIVHMAAGATRMWRRRQERIARGQKAPMVPLRLRIHRYAGYYIFAAFAGHVTATRGVSLVLGHDPDFTFLHFSLTAAPYFFYPYYALFAFAGAYHLAHGIFAGLKVLGAKVPNVAISPRSKLFFGYAIVWAVLGVLIVLALGGQLYDVNDARRQEWQQLFDELTS
jgi:succinate dehydrogenase/fumarate reductase cytochrome b subunit